MVVLVLSFIAKVIVSFHVVLGVLLNQKVGAGQVRPLEGMITSSLIQQYELREGLIDASIVVVVIARQRKRVCGAIDRGLKSHRD